MNRTDKNSEQLESILRQKMAPGSGTRETPQCPDPNLLAAYYERALPAGESETLENHLADCARCQLMLATLARADRGESAAPSHALARWFSGWRIAVPALAAAVLLIVVMQEMRPRDAAVEHQQIAALEKRDEPFADKLAAPPQMLAAPASSPIGALEMNEPKQAPEASTIGGDFRREARAKTDTLAKAEPPAKSEAFAKEKTATSGSGAEYSRALSPKLFGGTAASDAGSLAGSSRGDVAVAPGAASPATPPAAVMSGQMAEQASQSAAGSQAAGATGKPQSVSSSRTITAAIPRPGSSEAWTIGAGGAIYLLDETGGLHRQNSGVATDLLAGAALSREICWVVGRSGTVLRTTDGGEHWAKLTAPTPGDLASVSADSAAHAVVGAADGRKFATSDGGATWQSQ